MKVSDSNTNYDNNNSRMIRISGIVQESIVDGPGIRYVVFTQGCKHNCPGCHNPQTHSFEGGVLVDIERLYGEIMKNPLLDGITLSGGEPFEQAGALWRLAEKVRKAGMDVITYTGYTFEYILEKMKEDKDWERLLIVSDMLIDGRFEIEKKNELLKFRGSENQRIINVKKSLESGRAVEIEL
jgi:anaerobic ribonucleoside-triphosphate reductase activating protein